MLTCKDFADLEDVPDAGLASLDAWEVNPLVGVTTEEKDFANILFGVSCQRLCYMYEADDTNIVQSEKLHAKQS